ncbi:MAG: hypothetical protein Q8M15_10240 [Bacteroidota bacterium]|nr:hypothetical protein [Bacteroidota bacterium]
MFHIPFSTNKVCLLFAFMIPIFFACKNDRKLLKKNIDEREQAVLKMHDEVMPKMSKVLSLRKQLNAQIDTCKNQAWKDSLQQLSYQLTKSDLDMMAWMHQYQKPGLHDSSIVYLERQLELIAELKRQVYSSIENAEAVNKEGKRVGK